MMHPKISIVTVVWNAARDLERTLDSLTALDTAAADVELIVIDGGSTDGTLEVIRQFESRVASQAVSRTISWVSEPDGGLYDAMNKGIRAATGDYLWFVNAGDTVYGADVLTAVFRERPYADVYYGETVVVSAENGEELGLRKKRLPGELSWKSLQKGMVVCHQSFIVRREIAPFYDVERYRLAADVEWVIECLKRAKTIRNTGIILSRFAEGGISSQRRKESWKERWRIMREHYGAWATFWAHAGFFLGKIFDRKKYRSI